MVIGFAGYSQVGKDTAGNLLVREFGFKKISFAKKLKELAQPIMDFFGVNLNDLKQKEIVRPILVEIGRCGRKIDPDIWVNIVKEKILENPDQHWVITDVRYVNEVKMIFSVGGKVYWIERPGYKAANDEEEKSFLEIARTFPTLPRLYNEFSIIPEYWAYLKVHIPELKLLNKYHETIS